MDRGNPMRSGDSFLVDKNIPHSCDAPEGGIILDIFSPRRDLNPIIINRVSYFVQKYPL